MNKRHVLIGLVVFVFITTIAMVILSGDMTTLHSRAYRLFHRQGPGDISRSLALPNNTQSRSPTAAAAAATNTSSGTELHKPNATQQETPALKKPPPSTPAPPKAGAAQPVTNRPMTCKHCFQPNLANLTAVPEVCAGNTTPEMLMMITTSLDGLERRQAIRETWATVTKNNAAHVRHVFLLGTDKAGKVSEEVRAESARYKDLLVSNFVDVYGNLTYKTLAGLHYLVEHCATAKYFLKTDQDMYIFPEHILGLARKNQQTLQTSLGGSCYQSGRPWRDPKTKYYASIRSYPQSTYPGFCSGTGYIGSQNVARKIVELSPNVPFFHLEDVYLALVMRQAGYRLTKYPGFVEGAGVCGMTGGGGRSRAKNTMTIHEVSPQKIREMWAKKCGL